MNLSNLLKIVGSAKNVLATVEAEIHKYLPEVEAIAPVVSAINPEAGAVVTTAVAVAESIDQAAYGVKANE